MAEIPAKELGDVLRERDELARERDTLRRVLRLALSENPGQAALEGRFLEAVVARWRKGEDVYRGSSFAAPPRRLAGEMAEEVADVAGWALILWARLEALQATYDRLERLEELRSAAALALRENASDESMRRLCDAVEALD